MSKILNSDVQRFQEQNAAHVGLKDTPYSNARQGILNNPTPETATLHLGGLLAAYEDEILKMKNRSDVPENIKSLIQQALTLQSERKFPLPLWTYLKESAGNLDLQDQIIVAQKIAELLGFNYTDFVNGKVRSPQKSNT